MFQSGAIESDPIAYHEQQEDELHMKILWDSSESDPIAFLLGILLINKPEVKHC